MTVSRRRFLQAAGIAGAASSAPMMLVPSIAGAVGSTHAMVVIVLRGGIASLRRFGIEGVPDADADRLGRALRLAAGDGEFGAAASDAIAVIETAARVGESVRTDAYPDTRLGSSLADIAALLEAGVGLEVAVVDMGGWDTHALQGGETGRLANALDQLATGVAAFLTDLGPRLQSTTLAIVSEFGRRVEENASGGTDHGRAGVAFVAGGGIRGGRVLGDWPGLRRDQLDDGDVRVTTDVRDVFAEIVTGRLGNPDVADVFPGHQVRSVGFA